MQAEFNHDVNRIYLNNGEDGFLTVRCDKVDFLLTCEHDYFQFWYDSLSAYCKIVAEETGTEMNLNFRCEGASKKDKSLRIYKVSTWGLFADNLLRMLRPNELQFISRLDYRIECPVTDEGIAAFYDWMSNAHGRSRNVSLFNTRANNKTRGRAGGGKGAAVGSKGSPYRVAVYRRGKEQGAVEIQMQGKAVKSVLETARTVDGKLIPWTSVSYKMIMDSLAAHATSFVQQLTIDGLPQLTFFVGQETADEGEANRAAVIRDLKEILAPLGESERKAIAKQLGLKITDLL